MKKYGSKKVAVLFLTIVMFTIVFCSCKKETVDTADYNSMTFPNFTEENPVRYLQENEFGKFDGWQDFGKNGEIRTVAQPVGMTYTYQMYSWYIRNDLQQLYEGDELPEDIKDMPEWISDTTKDGRRILWYSMGRELPKEIKLVATDKITSDNGSTEFIKAQYVVTVDGISGDEVQKEWVIYFIEDDGVYSVFAVKANESYNTVMGMADSIVRSYEEK